MDTEEAWSPPEWVCNIFPLVAPEEPRLPMEYLLQRLNRMVDSCTEADTSPLGAVLHVAHMLSLRQGPDGAWPSIFDARSGQALTAERTLAPVPLFRRLNALLRSTEFDVVCRRAEAGNRASAMENDRN